MGQWNNFSAFSKVKIEIVALINEVLVTIENSIEPPVENTESLEAKGQRDAVCIANLKQVSDVLKILKHLDLALLADEMYALYEYIGYLDSLKDSEKKGSALRLLFQVANDFPAILHKTLVDGEYKLKNYLLLINKIRDFRKVSQVFLSKTLIECQDVDYSSLVENKSNGFNKKVIVEQDKYEKSVKSIVEGKDVRQSVEGLHSVFVNMEVLCRDYRIGTMWGICIALLESMHQLPAGENTDVLKKLCSFSKILEKIVNETDLTLVKKLPDSTLNKLLSSINHVSKNSERVASIKRIFNLDENLVIHYTNNYNTMRLDYYKRQSIVKSLHLVVDEITHVLDRINSETEELFKAKQDFLELKDELLSIKSTLTILNVPLDFKSFNQQVSDLENVITHYSGQDETGFTDVLFETAKALYKTELSLNSCIEEFDRKMEFSFKSNHSVELLLGPKKIIVDESINTLVSVNSLIDNYVGSGCDDSELRDIVEVLSQLSAALVTVPLPHAVEFINGARNYIKRLVECNKQLHVDTSFHNFVSLLINTKFYLERVADISSDELKGKVFAMNSIVKDLDSFSFDTFDSQVIVDSIAENSIVASNSADLSVDEEMIDDEIKLVFIEEAELLVSDIEKLFSLLLLDKDAEVQISELRRCFHTIKGSGRLVGAVCFGELAWHIENMLNKVINKTLTADEVVLDVLQSNILVLPALLHDFSSNSENAFSTDYIAENLNRINSIENSQNLISELVGRSNSSHEDDVVTIFTKEVDKQLESISSLLKDSQSNNFAGKVTISKFELPIHILQGNFKVANYVQAINITDILEKLIETLHHQLVNASFSELISVYLELISVVVFETKKHGNFDKIDVSDTESQQFSKSYEKFKDELSKISSQKEKDKLSIDGIIRAVIPKFIQKDKPVTDINKVNNVSTILGDYLFEAKKINAHIDKILANCVDTNNDFTCFLEINVQLAILQSASESVKQTEVVDVCKALILANEKIVKYQKLPEQSFLKSIQICHTYISSSFIELEANDVVKNPKSLLLALMSYCNIFSNSSAVPFDVANDIDIELLDVFLEEASEILQVLEKTVSDLHTEPVNKAICDDLLRSLHTIKGSAASVNAADISDLAHEFESFVINSQYNSEVMDKKFFNKIDSYLSALLQFHSLYSKDSSGNIVKATLTEGRLFEIMQPLHSIDELSVIGDDSNAINASSPLVEPDNEIQSSIVLNNQNSLSNSPVNLSSSEISRNLDEQVKVSSNLLKSLLNNADESSIARGRIEDGMNDLQGMLHDMNDTLGRFNNYIKHIDEYSLSNKLNPNNLSELNPENNQGFDDLEMDQYSQLQQISSALFENYNDLCDLQVTFTRKIKSTSNLLKQQQRSNNSLQSGLISTQMVPFSGIVPRLQRLTRQVCAELGKKVDIQFSNPDGKIDRSILQAMIVPLEHMIRNAIDHGIESPKERLGKSKPEIGVVMLKLYRQGPNIILDLSDDGAGIDVAAIKHKASINGLLAEGKDLTDQDAFQLIFKAGFSTTNEVSHISGRGVGMDVVHSEIKQIGGKIAISSTANTGTNFTIRLPFTASLNRALLFNLNANRFAMLLNTIDGIVLESVENLQSHYCHDEPPMIKYSDKSYELFYMGAMFNEGEKPVFSDSETSAPVLLISGKEKNMALQVDSIIGSRDYVIKPLGVQFSSIHGLSGAVIQPDGSVVMVLDPKSLVDRFDSTTSAVLQMPEHASKDTLVDKMNIKQTILVVDDSITVRKVTSRILERNGMNVIVAKNGIEAIELLQDTLPDVMLLDIEMPKMDGFEVATYIRRQEGAIKDLPIIMITSRIGDKHRSRAEEIGVNQYMGKPFQEESLLEAIAKYC